METNMYLLFDFDGTLVNSFDCVIEAIILLAEKYHFKKIKKHEIEKIRNLSSMELIQFLNIPLYKIPVLIHEMRTHLHNEIKQLTPVSGIIPILKKMRDENYTLGILTSNSKENVSLWLESHDMHGFFDFIYSESFHFTKRNLLRKTLKLHQIDKHTTFYICDETRDIDAAKKNEVKSIAVTWGYNSEKILKAHQPTFIARKPEDILYFVTNTD